MVVVFIFPLRFHLNPLDALSLAPGLEEEEEEEWIPRKKGPVLTLKECRIVSGTQDFRGCSKDRAVGDFKDTNVGQKEVCPGGRGRTAWAFRSGE